jgi:hypothetical protein
VRRAAAAAAWVSCAAQNPELMFGLDPTVKAVRVASYQKETVLLRPACGAKRNTTRTRRARLFGVPPSPNTHTNKQLHPLRARHGGPGLPLARLDRP